LVVNKSDLQRITKERILDARSLLDNGRWSAAYYLAGYAVECGLKACIIVHLMQTDQFPEKRFSEQCWTHNLAQLLGLAGLKAALDADAVLNHDLLFNWEVVKDRNESSRYARKTRTDAQELYDAITERKHGVLPWIKSHW
jgi:HEPN domain-containing protein